MRASQDPPYPRTRLARVTKSVDVADLNSAAPKGRVGSNPTPGTRFPNASVSSANITVVGARTRRSSTEKQPAYSPSPRPSGTDNPTSPAPSLIAYGHQDLGDNPLGPDSREVPAHNTFWFAWSQFHPETELWNRSTLRRPPKDESGLARRPLTKDCAIARRTNGRFPNRVWDADGLRAAYHSLDRSAWAWSGNR